MTRFTAGLVLLVTLIAVSASQYEVTLRQGILKGTERTTFSGRKVAAFLGVPYAKPPVRFQKSEKAEPWTGVWNATQAHSNCMMFSQGTYRRDPEHNVYGVEDCLYLDVYTPKIKSDKPMDVVVYFHGGCFMFLYGGHHGPKYLLDRHDIVLVHVNYRLGILGFLSTGDDVLPGNNGLKDQSLALQWIKENIAKFGGNPNSVTITGASAGGASVHYHYLSPMSKGLFAKGISMSGTTFVPWALTERTAAKNRAVDLAKLVGCPHTPSTRLVECLRTRPASDLVKHTQHFLKWYYNPFTTFGPVVEPVGEGRFITESPYQIVKSGKVQDLPWIASFTKDEGLYPASEILANATALKELNDDWLKIAPYLFDYVHTVPQHRWDEISKLIRDEYFHGRPVHHSIPETIQVQGDRFFTAYIVNTAKLQAQVTKSPIYTYQFSYRGKHSVSEKLSGGHTDDWGVCHGDDIGYVFEQENTPPFEREHDKKMSQQLVDMVATFAKTSQATFEGVKQWNTVSSKPKAYTYLDIQGPNKAKVRQEEDVGKEAFWLSLPLNELANQPYSKDEL